MSLNDKLDSIIKEFCKNLSFTYELPEEELYNIWKGKSVSKKEVKDTKEKEKPAEFEITKEKILIATKDMLAAMCKKKGLKMSGKKEELVARLMESISKVSTSSEKVVSKSVKNDSPVLNAVKATSGELAIRRNKFGNFEHMQTGLIFGSDKMVYGKQIDSGEVKAITSEDIETCKKYKFPYKLPENLNCKNLDDVKVDEIEEEEELDEDDIEEEEEELDEDVIDDDI